MSTKRPKIRMMKRLLPLIMLLTSSTAQAESGSYLVEVIVFRNLAVVTDAQETDELRSFSHYPDMEKPIPGPRLIEVATNEGVEDLSGDPIAAIRHDLPDDLHQITANSSRMNNVWRRLRSSADYEPLVFTAWQQDRTDYYPPMRIHDQQIIDTQLRPPTNIMIADLSAQDPLAAYRSTFYQLDGSVQLKRSRFLHLFLDLEYRQAGLPIETDTMTDSSALPGIFTLKQNRQIRTGQVQYFDTPYFGALIYVSAISAKPDS